LPHKEGGEKLYQKVAMNLYSLVNCSHKPFNS